MVFVMQIKLPSPWQSETSKPALRADNRVNDLVFELFRSGLFVGSAFALDDAPAHINVSLNQNVVTLVNSLPMAEKYFTSESLDAFRKAVRFYETCASNKQMEKVTDYFKTNGSPRLKFRSADAFYGLIGELNRNRSEFERVATAAYWLGKFGEMYDPHKAGSMGAAMFPGSDANGLFERYESGQWTDICGGIHASAGRKLGDELKLGHAVMLTMPSGSGTAHIEAIYRGKRIWDVNYDQITDAGSEPYHAFETILSANGYVPYSMGLMSNTGHIELPSDRVLRAATNFGLNHLEEQTGIKLSLNGDGSAIVKAEGGFDDNVRQVRFGMFKAYTPYSLGNPFGVYYNMREKGDENAAVQQAFLPSMNLALVGGQQLASDFFFITEFAPYMVSVLPMQGFKMELTPLEAAAAWGGQLKFSGSVHSRAGLFYQWGRESGKGKEVSFEIDEAWGFSPQAFYNPTKPTFSPQYSVAYSDEENKAMVKFAPDSYAYPFGAKVEHRFNNSLVGFASVDVEKGGAYTQIGFSFCVQGLK